MSVRFFLYSINRCEFKTKYCNSIADFKLNNCYKQNSKIDVRMGYYADKSDAFYKTSHGSFFVNTIEKAPYCVDQLNLI
jgi:hypothetical protein